MMGREDRIETAQIGSVALVALVGEHDLATSAALASVVEVIARPGACVVLDASQATFIDSTVIGVMVYAAHNADALAIVAPDAAPCRRMLDLVDIGSVITICSSQDDAVRHVLGEAESRGRPGMPQQLEVADRVLDAAWVSGEGVEEALVRVRELSVAVGREPLIEDAKLLVAEAQKCSPSEAFQRMITVSQTQNRKLAELARQLVERGAAVPDDG